MSCPDCFSGHQHDGTPKGKLIELHGLDTYVAEPEDDVQPKGIIVIIPDAFGIEFVNNKLLADSYAKKGGYKVYLPDFMLGRSAPIWMIESMRALLSPGNYLSKPYHTFWVAYAFLPWVLTNRPGRTFPTVKNFFEALRSSTEGTTLPLGVAGFCWGGKHALLLTREENYSSSSSSSGERKPLLDAAFVGHPSFFEHPRDAELITVPTSFAVPERDHQIKVPAVSDEIARILEGKGGELKVYENCGHGFCVRADFLEGDVASQAAAAENQATTWFTSHLRRSTS
ncbi:alpha/beta-hydrolase [Cryphonectria parasitica EP155]|uniref:Alpha/beta-hydrolase n=1 Tax=Cryphonectria parasitica (strain ATCC 38755 / EP155) TaxID=660469 RepID=A0A9P4XVN8_CRYP1|nr:alpha/beta-hydrolase [Cryphonectria parasitica EP155]KAF3761430.1 alpha/beta-hydrolase [Cryphonectria parasitica EP155]